MRSPIAEAMLKTQLAKRCVADVIVRSAGLHAVPGRHAHEWAMIVSQEFGLDLSKHRAQTTTPALIESSDLIVAMDFQNLAELQALFPSAEDRFLLLGHCAEGKWRNRQIPDPYFGNLQTVRSTCAILKTCIRNFAAELRPSQQLEEVLREELPGGKR